MALRDDLNAFRESVLVHLGGQLRAEDDPAQDPGRVLRKSKRWGGRPKRNQASGDASERCGSTRSASKLTSSGSM